MILKLNLHFRSGSQKSCKKRRRIATPQQRRAANIRERRRMFNLNEAFDRLRTKVRELENYISPLVLISEKDHLFEIENDQIFIHLLIFVAYKLHILFKIKSMPF